MMRAITFLAVVLSAAVVVQGQNECFSQCGGSSLGSVGDLLECCIDMNGGGFILEGETSCRNCEPFRVIRPEIEVISSQSIPVDGADFTLTCIITTATNASASIDVDWINPSGTIVESLRGVSTMATLLLEFTPFASTDTGMYTCSASITSPEAPGTTVFISRTLRFEDVAVTVPAPSPRISIAESGRPVVGGMLMLTCRVSGTLVTPSIEWFGPDGMVVTSGQNVIVGNLETSGSTTARTLTFTSLSEADVGQYTCRNNLTSPSTLSTSVFLLDMQTDAIQCVTDCGTSGVIIDQSNTIIGCCGASGGSGLMINGGLSYEFAREGVIICQSCADFDVLQTDFSFRVDSPIAIGEDFTADCIVMTDALADATANITWRSPDGTVVAEQSIMSPTASLPLTFQQFEASNFGEYSCSATITSSQLPGTVAFIERSFGILGSPDIVPVSITEDAPPVVGEPYTLTCRVNGIGGTPSIQWIGPNSQPIVSGPGVTVGDPVTVGTVTTSTLMFSAISLLDSGRYLCQNDLTSPNTAARTLTVEVPQPEITFTSASPPIEGRPYQNDCSGTVPDSLLGFVNSSWIDSNGVLIASQTGTGSATAALSFNQLQPSDAGTYTCVVTVSSSLLNRPFSTDSTFNLDVGVPVDDCAQDCDMNALCIDTPQGFQCVCNPGFTGDGITCTDIDECSLGRNNCDRKKFCNFFCMRVSICTNTPGGFSCSCRTGFTGPGTRCTDINECEEGLDNCHSNAMCKNTAGSFRCRCRRGFVGDGVINCCRREKTRTRTRARSESNTGARSESNTGAQSESNTGTQSESSTGSHSGTKSKKGKSRKG